MLDVAKLRLRMKHALDSRESFYVTSDEWVELRRTATRRPDPHNYRPPEGLSVGLTGQFTGVRIVVDDVMAAALDITLGAYWYGPDPS